MYSEVKNTQFIVFCTTIYSLAVEYLVQYASSVRFEHFVVLVIQLYGLPVTPILPKLDSALSRFVSIPLLYFHNLVWRTFS